MGQDDIYKHVRKGGLKLKGKKPSVTAKSNQFSEKEEDREGGDDAIAAEECGKEEVAVVTDNSNEEKLANVNDDIKRILALQGLTEAERAFQLARHIRRKERIEKRLALTHRERMASFNAQLAKLSEHFDIPKVGPG